MAGKFDAAIKDLMWRGMPALLGPLVERVADRSQPRWIKQARVGYVKRAK
jgi:hypothetical protein